MSGAEIQGVSAHARAVAGKNKALWRAAENFEAIFVQRLLGEMEAARLGPNGLSGPGAGIYRGMLDHQVAEKVASQDPFGIARLLVEQLGAAAGAPRNGSAASAAAAPGHDPDPSAKSGTPSPFSSSANVPYTTVSRR